MCENKFVKESKKKLGMRYYAVHSLKAVGCVCWKGETNASEIEGRRTWSRQGVRGLGLGIGCGEAVAG